MCQYNVTLTTIQSLSTLCATEFPKITKCAAGGRDHLPCCSKRGVSEECQPICQGLQYDPTTSIFTTCSTYIGNIMLCLEEGKLKKLHLFILSVNRPFFYFTTCRNKAVKTVNKVCQWNSFNTN